MSEANGVLYCVQRPLPNDCDDMAYNFFALLLLTSIAVLLLDAIAFGIWTIVIGFGVVPSIFPGIAIITVASGIAGFIGMAVTE